MPWRGPAGEARHTGVMIGVWEREGKALGVPPRIAGAIRTKTAPWHGAKPPDALRAGQVGQRASGNERGTSACGLAQEHRTLRSMATGHAGQSASSRKTPAPLAPAPDRHPDGPGLQARSAQRIEQVARQGSGIAATPPNISERERCPRRSSRMILSFSRASLRLARWDRCSFAVAIRPTERVAPFATVYNVSSISHSIVVIQKQAIY
jgi:hypothetical protein